MMEKEQDLTIYTEELIKPNQDQVMRISLLFLFSILLISKVSSQRYKDQIFDEVSKQTVTYLDEKNLQMDIYQPVGDVQKDRPVILFVHGGGFAGGARNEPEIMDFCKNMARRGIVAVSMTYTLVMKGKSFSCDQPSENKLATFKQVGIEINEAANYLIQNKESNGISDDLITLAGSSAGAEAVLHAAFWEETQANLPEGFSYAGLISMAGAIYDLDFITRENAIPMQLFHGTCDDLVPYGTAPHHYCQEKEVGYLILHGPGAIVEKLKSLNKGYYLITGCNDNHSWAGRPFKKYRSEIADFVWQDVLLGKFRQIHQIIPSNGECQLVEAPSICND